MSDLALEPRLSLLDEDAAERRRLADFAMRLRYPAVDDGSGVGVDELLSFFRASGFLHPATEAVLAPVMKEVRETFARSYAQPSDVFKAVVVRENGRLVGHVSGVRAYGQTWMPTHLASLPNRHVAHLLNLGAAEYFLQRGDFEHFKIYFHADSKWPARVFGGFARMQQDATVSDLRSIRQVILPTGAEMPPGPSGIEVIEASDGDLAFVERHLVTREPGLIVRADDLTRETLLLSELDESFAEIALHRSRRVLVAMRRGTCLGFALVQLSSPGLNLSEALSAFQIFVTDEGHAIEGDVRRALLRAVLPVYRDAGRAQARCFVAPGDVAVHERLGLAVDDDEWSCWTYHHRLCPAFCDYVERMFEVLRRRQQRRAERGPRRP